MISSPRLSIITVNFNNLEGLRKTVNSVIDQTWKEFEYIIIDGGSTDGSKEFIENNKNQFDYWVSEPDDGIYNAMNKGVKAANGEYLLFLNSGDHFFSKESLNRNKEYINKFDLIYFDIKVVDGQKSYIKTYPADLSFSYLMMDTLPHTATFIKKSLFIVIGPYDENLDIIADWKFFIISICKENVSYLKINEVLSIFYYDGISSKIENQDPIFNEKQQVLAKEFPMFLNEKKELQKLREVIKNLKKSRKINLLIRLGLINKF